MLALLLILYSHICSFIPYVYQLMLVKVKLEIKEQMRIKFQV